jgi:osmotically-inducible protein OsmY
MRSDPEIKRDVEFELRWDPDIDSTDIGVAVKDGVVTLTGFVQSYGDKWKAETAAKRVSGVVGLANDIEVRLPAISERPDPDIARDAVAALKNELPHSYEAIRVIVRAGWATIEGEVEWNYQKERAEKAVRRVKGLKGVVNTLQLKPKVAPTDLKRQIEDAFKRNAEVDANRITVEVSGTEVTLKGTVRSWAERQDAERVAWRAPGIAKVNNQININPAF